MSQCRVLVLAGLATFLLVSALRAQEDGARELKRPVLLDPYGDRLPAGALARMGSMRFRHGSPMCTLVFSPNGKIVATVGADHKVRLWDFASGQELRELAVPTVDNQVALAFSPDGKMLALAAGNPRILLWDLSTGKELHRFENLQVSVSGLAFAPDGKTLASTGNNAMVHLWDVASGKETSQLQWRKEEPKPAEKENGILKAIRLVKDLVAGDNELAGEQFFSAQTVAYSPDGKMLAAAGYDGTGQGRIRLWDMVKGKQLREWTGQQGQISKLAFSPDSKKIAVVADNNQNSILLFDPSTGKELHKLTATTDAIVTFAFAPDSNKLAYAGQLEGVRIVDAVSGKEVRKLEGTRQGIFSLAFAPDGKSLACGGRDGVIRVWDTANWREQRPYGGHDAAISAVAVTAEGTRIVTASSDRSIRLWDALTGKELRRIAAAESNDQLHGKAILSSDGKLLATTFVKVDPTGNQDEEGQIRLWDLDSGKVLRKFAVPEVSVGALALAPGNKLLASAWVDGMIRLHDVHSGKEVRQFRFHQHENPEEPIFAGNIALAFSPDGKLLATREVKRPMFPDDDDLDGSEVTSHIRLWEVASGKLRRSLEFKGFVSEQVGSRIFFNRFALAINGLDDDVDSPILAFSPDGKFLALPSYENIHLVNLATGKEVRRFGGHQVNPGTAVFSPDGRMLAAGTFDGSLRVWDVATGTVLAEFAGHRGTIQSLTFSSDGKQLVSGGADTTALVWDVPGLIDDQRLRPADLSARKLDACWSDLAADDATRADRAILDLAAAPHQAVPFLRQMLKPRAVSADAKRIDKLIADLDSNQFSVREKSMQELEKLGRLAEPALRKVLTTRQPSLELRRRMERLLDKLEGPINSPDLMRSLRALEVLEQIATPEARAVIDSLAKGPADEELTQQAQAARERLMKRP